MVARKASSGVSHFTPPPFRLKLNFAPATNYGSSTSNRVRVGCEKIRAQQSSSLAKRPASQEDGRGPYTGILSQSGVSCQGADWQGEHWHPFAQGTSLPLSPVP